MREEKRKRKTTGERPWRDKRRMNRSARGSKRTIASNKSEREGRVRERKSKNVQRETPT